VNGKVFTFQLSKPFNASLAAVIWFCVVFDTKVPPLFGILNHDDYELWLF
jgi:hypothetical protein